VRFQPPSGLEARNSSDREPFRLGHLRLWAIAGRPAVTKAALAAVMIVAEVVAPAVFPGHTPAIPTSGRS
jgi:hypothetical protein